MDTPIAYFVRHGETAGNAKGTFRGTGEYPLNAQGKADAKNLAKWFSDKAISAVYSSSLGRTRETAEAIAVPKGIKVQPIDALKSIDVGYLSGEPKEDHKHVMDYFEKYPHERIPMGESLNEFRTRTQPPIKKILVEGARAKTPVVAVVHSSIIHELNHIVHGDHNQNLVKPGGIVGVFKHP
ncbi:MAG TPA: histidine phosphatase family protein, partial [Anaerolineales bacterium]|nr:histidine phosphatase family protein [Anaerolineales bacterium]